MRDAWPDRGPKAVDATGVDDVALLGVLQHRQKRAGAVIDAAPADVERALPFVAAIGNHAAAAADTGVVEQQVDLVGLVTVGNLVAKPLDLRLRSFSTQSVDFGPSKSVDFCTSGVGYGWLAVIRARQLLMW